MKIALETPIAFSEVGRRSGNEDTVYPSVKDISPDARLFMVLDGVGGQSKGEVASQLASECFADFLESYPTSASDEEYWAKALAYTEGAFDKYLEKNPDATGMGTTLTLLHLHDNGATIAHCGDSRIYVFRNGKLLYRTEDHSYVNELLKREMISLEEAVDHPKRHVITRAIMGKSVKATKLDVVHLVNLQQGDRFLLCSDGVLEAIDEDRLTETLAGDADVEQAMQAIQALCAEKSNDNYSAYLVEIAATETATTTEENQTEILKSNIGRFMQNSWNSINKFLEE